MEMMGMKMAMFPYGASKGKLNKLWCKVKSIECLNCVNRFRNYVRQHATPHYLFFIKFGYENNGL